jgi:beta-galactosidase
MLYIDPGGWLAHQPAMVTRSLGLGTLSYLGALPDSSTLAAILKKFASAAGIVTSNSPPPSGFELCERRTADGSHRVLIVINHNSAPGHITFPTRYRNLLDPQAHSQTTVDLPAQGVAVLIPEDSR